MTKYRLRNITISVALAAIGALLVGLYVVSYRNDVQKGADTVSVLVAARDIPEGTAGTEVASGGYLKSAQVLRRNVVPGAIAKGSELGSVVAAGTIYQGEQVTVRQFEPQAQAGIFSKFSGLQRAMVISGDANQLLAGTVQNDDRVDVIANVHYRIGQTPHVASRTVLADVPVIQAPDSPKAGGLGGDNSSASSITLAVTSAQAQRLLFAVKNSDWWLVLRPSAHPKTPPPSIETLNTFLANGLPASALLQLTGGAPAAELGQ